MFSNDLRSSTLPYSDGDISNVDVIRYEKDRTLIISQLQAGFFVDVGFKKENTPFEMEGYFYDKKGNLDNIYYNFDIFVKTKDVKNSYQKMDFSYGSLRKNLYSGNGYWTRFYYEQNEEFEYIITHIKEEGEVKNNYKVGEWKYYNKNGEIDSLKVYSVKDSVDIRFPHCLFNKNEPCY